MAFVHGKDSVFSLDDSGGTLRAMTSYIDQVQGLPGARNLSNVTTLGAQGTRSIPGLANVSFSIQGHYDPTTTTGPHAVLNSLRDAPATATFEYGPEGSAAGKTKMSGECWLQEYNVTSTAADKVSFTASFQVDGVVTAGTYS